MDTFEGDNEDPLSLHKYLYCHDNPVNKIDPSGHDGIELAIDFGMMGIMASMPNIVTVGKAVETLPEQGEKILIDRFNLAKTYLESRNVQHHGKNAASCIGVNQPIANFMSPLPSPWICRLEHRSHWYGFPISTLADHWAVVCRTGQGPTFRQLLFDYWGDRPAGENPNLWFRSHYEGILPGSYDIRMPRKQAPCDYGYLSIIPVGAN
jgi:hypothetical protein